MKRPGAKQQVRLTAKCIGCRKSKVLTESEIKSAQELGVVMCECGMPMTVSKAEVSG